ncbi:hypothetical protein EDD53_0071 [Pacificibacter maritimus]|uniref:Uncharacterized protein n=1 Tax=Pacificibacter maritimus TaxID=762213 RepID=A0A3N4UTZ6_9RHOB|nr:hypothetical protein [Pacificibacter maritimus]RPE70959.1 hypothetical protein EDD53_0071 [Pacificibacter maritimus]
MSDPMTNIDADDVLASIRRLVSETYDPMARKAKPTPVTDRLVLSPDLRVVEGKKPSENDRDTTAQSSVERSQAPATTVTSGKDIQPLILEAQDAVTPVADASDETHAAPIATDDDSGADVSEPSDNQNPLEVADVVNEDLQGDAVQSERGETVEDAVLAAQALMRDVPQPVSADTPPEPQETTTQAEPHHAPSTSMSIEERIAELEAAVEEQPVEAAFEDWQADETAGYDGYEEDYDADEPTAFSPAWANPSARVLDFQSASAAKFTHAQHTDVAEAPEPEVVDQTADVATDHADQDHDLEGPSDFEAFEHDVQKDKMSEEAEAAEASPFETTAEALQESDHVAYSGSEDDDDDLALAGYSDQELLDEGALRDMIAEVIREELQGSLGERITSNVRRLVRREVQRALTLRDFE